MDKIAINFDASLLALLVLGTLDYFGITLDGWTLMLLMAISDDARAPASQNPLLQFNSFLIISYNPDFNSDPYGEEGILWSFNYFFYNKKLKRIVFFTSRSFTNTPEEFGMKINDADQIAIEQDDEELM